MPKVLKNMWYVVHLLKGCCWHKRAVQNHKQTLQAKPRGVGSLNHTCLQGHLWDLCKTAEKILEWRWGATRPGFNHDDCGDFGSNLICPWFNLSVSFMPPAKKFDLQLPIFFFHTAHLLLLLNINLCQVLFAKTSWRHLHLLDMILQLFNFCRTACNWTSCNFRFIVTLAEFVQLKCFWWYYRTRDNSQEIFKNIT